MRISYAITVCNEIDEIQNLITFLLHHKQEEDEIVVLYDNNTGSEDVLNYLCTQTDNIDAHFSNFNGHFAEWKNLLTTHCKGDYIFQIDADEIPPKYLLDNIHIICSENDCDLYWVPRVNTVDGVTLDHIDKWGWRMNEKGWINFPDYQARLYKNVDYINWVRPVHELIQGSKTHTYLPKEELFSIRHHKNIETVATNDNRYMTIGT